MISYSFLLLIIGMGTVFLFLLLIMGSILVLEKFTATARENELKVIEAEEAASQAKRKKKQSAGKKDNGELISVITAAVASHRARA